MSKIKLTDSMLDIAIKMSEGNPGALTLIMEIMKEGYEKIQYILICDTLGLYGSRLYQLWNDCCQRDTNKVFKVLDKFQKGEINKEYLLNCIDQPYGLNIEI